MSRARPKYEKHAKSNQDLKKKKKGKVCRIPEGIK